MGYDDYYHLVKFEHNKTIVSASTNVHNRLIITRYLSVNIADSLEKNKENSSRSNILLCFHL